jgi:acyl carrier protein
VIADLNDTAELEAVVLTTLSGVLNEPVGDLRAQPVLAAHEWDSLASLEVLSQLESQLGVTLDLRAYHATRTVEDLTCLVAASVASKSTAGRR